MPIYEYSCAKCEREFEVEQRITDDPIKTCPHCRSRRVKRLISQTSFTLKGGGWYADGYASKNGASKESAKTDASESTGKSDSKDSGAGKSSKSEKSSDGKKAVA